MITSYQHDLASFAINKTILSVPYDQVLIFSDKKIPVMTDKVRYFKIDSSFSVLDWNQFVNKQLVDFIDTDHALIIQPDGFACNKEFWDDRFLSYDFISSPYCVSHPKVSHTIEFLKNSNINLYKNPNITFPSEYIINGAGGLSLRSKKFMKAVLDYENEIVVSTSDKNSIPFKGTGEDFTVSFLMRNRLIDKGITFADLPLTFKFSNEDISNHGLSLGFHGFQFVPWFLTEIETLYVMQFMNFEKMIKFGSFKEFECNLYLKDFYTALSYISFWKKSSHHGLEFQAINYE